MDNLELASPIATLRSLGALEGDQEDIFSPYDPITRGVLTFQEAQDAFHVYFQHCHPWAPALSESLRHTGMGLRQSSPALFLAIVSVGTRFWHNNSVHPRYFEIIALLDKTISRLLLCPTPNDASVDSIRALMLYLQWMPCAPKNSPDDSSVGPHSRRAKLKTRYNDMSAWAVFGLALRYASFLNLERLALAPFHSPTKTAISRDDVDRMRTWLNLITYDCNLTLTSGLAISVNPLPAMKVVRDFCMHRTAQDPGDLRYGALIELACIIQRVKGSDGGISNRQPTVPNLKKANVEMEEWERHWLQQLKHTPLQHIQLPFTSLRWYRLSLNSSILRPLLSSSTRSQTDIFQVWTLGFLETSITAASQILLSLVTNAHQFIWRVNSQSFSTYPRREFSIEPTARLSLHHAVDATWISFTFALTFLVLCYIRKTIDDDLQILGIPTMDISTARAPSRPRPDSLLARLTRLSMDIFEAESDGPEFRSGGGYEAIIRDAASLVLDKGQDQPASIAQDPLDPAIQSLFDLMDDTVYEWPSIYENDGGAEPNFADVWGPRC
ncbi:putative Zn(2)-C6 fungal-type domain-containing protein [Seiridium cardinale]